MDVSLLDNLADAINEYPADLIMFQMAKVTEAGKVLKRYKKPPFKNADKVLSVNDVYLSLVQDGQVLASACNKCIRVSLVRENHIEFPQGCFAEDVD